MCDPFTILAAGLSAGGSLLSGAGAMAGGSAKSRSLKMQAEVERINADLARRSGAFEAGRVRDQAESAADAAVGHYAAAGVDPSFGGPAFAQAWSMQQGEQDAQIALARGATDAANREMTAASLIGQAGDARRAGRLSMAASVLQAGSTMFAALGKGGAVGQPTTQASMAAPLSTGDPWGLGAMRWGMTGGQPSFWHR